MYIIPLFYSCQSELSEFSSSQSEIKEELNEKPEKSPTIEQRQVVSSDKEITWTAEENRFSPQTPWKRRFELEVNAGIARLDGKIDEEKVLTERYHALTNILNEKSITPFNSNADDLKVKRMLRKGVKNFYADKEKKLIAKKIFYEQKIELFEQNNKGILEKTIYFEEAEKVVKEVSYSTGGKEMDIPIKKSQNPVTNHQNIVYWSVVSVSYSKIHGAAKHVSSFAVTSSGNKYDDVISALYYGVVGTASITLKRLSIDKNITLEEGIADGKTFRALAGSMVNKDGEKYTGGFKSIGSALTLGADGNYSLTLAGEDWTDGDYNDMSVDVVLSKVECYCPVSSIVNFYPGGKIKINEDTVAEDNNFISGKTLEIEYTFEGPVPSSSDMSFEIESLRSDKSYMKTPTATIVHDSARKRLKITIPKDTGSSTSGYKKKTLGLRYKIIYKVKGSEKQTFKIEQDDINRARQEYVVFGQTTPNRLKFTEVYNLAGVLITGDTKVSYSSIWLEGDLTSMDNTIKVRFPNRYYSSSWRSPYVNKKHGGVTDSKHMQGKALDLYPDGKGQAQSKYETQWDDVVALGFTLVLMESGDMELRSSKNSWKDIPSDHKLFNKFKDDKGNIVNHWGHVPHADVTVEGLLYTAGKEIGWLWATHFHIEK